jgi:signal transduction histidine kinase
LQSHVEATFHSIAQDKNLEFRLNFDDRLPRAIYTDTKRLQQVLKNLLSNAFKFTEQGHVSLSVSVASQGWSADAEVLNRAGRAIAFAVSDTGIGIASDKKQVIFEAFQQADGKTNRKYGGTGLGLSISREIARLLGGEIRLISELGKGSTFILYLPQTYYPSVEVTKRQGDSETRRQADTQTQRRLGAISPLSPPSPPLPLPHSTTSPSPPLPPHSPTPHSPH